MEFRYARKNRKQRRTDKKCSDCTVDNSAGTKSGSLHCKLMSVDTHDGRETERHTVNQDFKPPKRRRMILVIPCNERKALVMSARKSITNEELTIDQYKATKALSMKKYGKRGTSPPNA